MSIKVKPYEGKLVRNGTGLQVAVPQHIVRYLELERGDILKVELTVLDKNGKVKDKKAHYEFETRYL